MAQLVGLSCNDDTACIIGGIRNKELSKKLLSMRPEPTLEETLSLCSGDEYVERCGTRFKIETRREERRDAKRRYDTTTRQLKPIPVNSSVRVQNHLTKLWDLRGHVIAVSRNRDYRVRMSSGRKFWRKRRFVKLDHTPPSHQVPRTPPKTLLPPHRRRHDRDHTRATHHTVTTLQGLDTTRLTD